MIGRARFVDTVALLLGLAMLALLLLPVTTLARLFPNDRPQPFDLQTSLPLFLCNSAGIVVAAILLGRGLRARADGRGGAAILLLGAMLLGTTTLHNFYWLLVWDRTYDSLWVFWLFPPLLAVIGAAVWLAAALPERVKGGALVFLLAAPIASLAVFAAAQRVDTAQLTAGRAARLAQALDDHYARRGVYPARLAELTPGYLWTLGEPVAIFGEGWCYASNGRAARLGYVNRDHWSSPELFAQVVTESETAAAELPALCAGEIAALQARDPAYYQAWRGRERP